MLLSAQFDYDFADLLRSSVSPFLDEYLCLITERDKFNLMGNLSCSSLKSFLNQSILILLQFRNLSRIIRIWLQKMYCIWWLRYHYRKGDFVGIIYINVNLNFRLFPFELGFVFLWQFEFALTAESPHQRWKVSYWIS